MDLGLLIRDFVWRPILTIPRGTVLERGRRGLYDELTAAAGAVSERFGCYSWGSEATTYYCGSFARDYSHGHFRSNLEGRVHNYLQTHQRRRDGFKNTNLLVFESINAALQREDILLRLLTFSSLQVGEQEVSFAEYAQDADLVHTVEQLVICTYRKRGECGWNRG